MKTSNGVLFAVVVFVLGLCAAVSPPQALAAEVERIHPATMCVKSAGGANITRSVGGTILNASSTAELIVHCDVVNEHNVHDVENRPKIIEGLVVTTDRHPSLDIRCILIQAARSFQTSNIFFQFVHKVTNGAANSLNFMSYDAPDPNNLTGFRSNNYFACFIPPRAPNGAVSEFHFYSVVEE